MKKISFVLIGCSSFFWFIYNLLINRQNYINGGYSLQIDLMIVFSVLCFVFSITCFFFGKINQIKESTLSGIALLLYLINSINFLIESFMLANIVGSSLMTIVSIFAIVIQVVGAIITIAVKKEIVALISSILSLVVLIIYLCFYITYNLINETNIVFVLGAFAFALLSNILFSLSLYKTFQNLKHDK